jgi:hypothetical membrane protein
MVRSRTAGFLGIAAAVISWSALWVFGALRPSYSHTRNAVSELGALGSPLALLWNLIGFIVPGILLAIAGGAVAASVGGKPRRTVAFWLLIISGLGFAGTGLIPAELENGVALVTSPFTKGHFIMSLIQGIAWLIAALLLVRPMQRHSEWRSLTYINVALVMATVGASFALRGRLSDALVQRIAGRSTSGGLSSCRRGSLELTRNSSGGRRFFTDCFSLEPLPGRPRSAKTLHSQGQFLRSFDSISSVSPGLNRKYAGSSRLCVHWLKRWLPSLNRLWSARARLVLRDSRSGRPNRTRGSTL